MLVFDKHYRSELYKKIHFIRSRTHLLFYFQPSQVTLVSSGLRNRPENYYFEELFIPGRHLLTNSRVGSAE